MENIELQKIWKNINAGIPQKSIEELNLLLTSKTKQTLNKFLLPMSISILVCIALIIYLTITSLNRQDDLIYIINNLTLGLITTIALFSGMISWYKLQNNRYNQPLKEWLEVRIHLLSKWLTGKQSKLYVLLIPILYTLTVLSIHVYFENKTFIEVLNTKESIIGLVVGTLIGLFVSYFAVRKIRKYQMLKLEFLNDLYGRLNNAR